MSELQVCNGGRPFDRAGELGSSSSAKSSHHLTQDHNALCGKRPKLSNKCDCKNWIILIEHSLVLSQAHVFSIMFFLSLYVWLSILYVPLPQGCSCKTGKELIILEHLVVVNQCIKYHSFFSPGELLLELLQGSHQPVLLSLACPGPGKRQVGRHWNSVLPELTRLKLESCWGDG